MPGGAIGRAGGRRVVTTCVLEARSCRARFSRSPSGQRESTIQPMPVTMPTMNLRSSSRRRTVERPIGRPSLRTTRTPVACLPNVWPLCVPLRLIVSAKYAVQRSTTTSSHHRPLMSSDVESGSSTWENGMTAAKAIAHAMARSMQAAPTRAPHPASTYDGGAAAPGRTGDGGTSVMGALYARAAARPPTFDGEGCRIGAVVFVVGVRRPTRGRREGKGAAIMKLTTMTQVTIHGVIQGNGGASDDRRNGFERGGWARGRAIAVAELDGPQVAPAAVNRLEHRLAGYLAYHATRADLLRRLGRGQESRAPYDKATELAGNTAETAYLTSRRGGGATT